MVRGGRVGRAVGIRQTTDSGVRVRGGCPFAYVQVPDLPIQVERRRDAGLRTRPVIIVGGRGGADRQSSAEVGLVRVVQAASDEARALGVLPGQTQRQASHLCPEAVVLPSDAPAYAAAFTALLAALGSCTPTVQPHPVSFGAELDIGGLELLFGPERALAGVLVQRAARAGLRARVGIGSNRLVARLAAGLAAPGDFVVVAPSEARAFLEPLPLSRLPLEEESRERLELLGVRTLGRLLRLPRTGLAQQIGPDALALARAVDAEGELLVPYQPAEWLVAETELEFSLETREQLVRVLTPLAEGLAARLRERYLGASLIRLRLDADRLESRLPAPTASVDTMVEAALSLAESSSRLRRSPGTFADPSLTSDFQYPDWLELSVGDLGSLGGRQGRLFDGQPLRRAQAARAVEELAGRFRGRLQAPSFGQRA